MSRNFRVSRHLEWPAAIRGIAFAFVATLAAVSIAFGMLDPETVASAQGESAYEGDAGPYRVSVDVVPERPVAGKVQFRVRPQERPSGTPMTDAQIEIYLDRSGQNRLKSPALNSPADRAIYVGNADLTEAGDWNVRVEVRSSPGTGDFQFVLPVHARARSGRGLVAPTLVYLGAAVIIAGGAGWLVVSSRRVRRQ